LDFPERDERFLSPWRNEMKPTHILIAMLVAFLFLAPALLAQSPDSANQSAASSAQSPSAAEVPRLIKFSGTLLDAQDGPMAGPVGVTFALYSQQTGGAALWMETQNIKPDASGVYTVLLGANSANGVPAELFASGEARWLEVQVERQAEQPRVLLVSVPYALKAGDAQTLGGKPASAYALAGAGVSLVTSTTGTSGAPVAATGGTALAASTSGPQPLNTASTPVTTAGGTVGNLAKFDASADITNSGVSENGNFQVGIGGAPSTNAKLFLTDTQTDFGTKWLQQGLFITKATKSGSNTALTFDMDMTNMLISPGVTDSGARLAFRSLSYANSLGFAGTLNQQIGILAQAGIRSAANTAKVISAFGGQFTILNQVPGTTITNAYGVWIKNSDIGGTITNRYDLYASSPNANNFFAGNVGIGITAPAQKLSVAGMIESTSGGFKFPDHTVQTTAGGTGTITGVTTAVGSGLTGGGTSGTLALAVDATVARTNAINTFTADQNIFGNLNLTAATSTISAFGGTFVGSGGGVAGKDTSMGGIGVFGNASNPTGPGVGVFGVSPADNAAGVIGKATSLTGLTSGLVALAASTGAVAAFAHATATTGNTFAVQGIADSTAGIGVYGNATATSGTTAGVQGNSASLSGVGGYFTNSAGGFMLAAVDSGGKPILAADPNGAYVHTAVFTSNNDATGTLLNELVKYTSADTVSVTGAGDPGGAIGIVVSGAGTAGTAVVAYFGEAHCAFDNTTAVADYFQISPTVAGQCHDAGPAYPANGRQVLGRVTKITSVPPKVFLFGGEETRPGGVYNISGALQSGHVVTGSVTLSSGTATVTLSGAAAFTSSTSYVCVATPTTAAATVTVSQASGTSFTLNSATLAAGVNFTCTGN
jgi:hypothetical protein